MICRCGHQSIAHTSNGRCILCSCTGFQVAAQDGDQSALLANRPPRNAWVIRASDDIRALIQPRGAIGVSWSIPSDVSDIRELGSMIRFFREQPHLRHESDARQRSTARQLFTFVHEVEIGDQVLTPIPERKLVLVGTVTGSYQFAPEIFPRDRYAMGHPHTREIDWICELPRPGFSTESLKTLSLLPTVIPATRHLEEINRLVQRFREARQPR